MSSQPYYWVVKLYLGNEHFWLSVVDGPKFKLLSFVDDPNLATKYYHEREAYDAGFGLACLLATKGSLDNKHVFVLLRGDATGVNLTWRYPLNAYEP